MKFNFPNEVVVKHNGGLFLLKKSFWSNSLDKDNFAYDIHLDGYGLFGEASIKTSISEEEFAPIVKEAIAQITAARARESLQDASKRRGVGEDAVGRAPVNELDFTQTEAINLDDIKNDTALLDSVEVTTSSADDEGRDSKVGAVPSREQVPNVLLSVGADIFGEEHNITPPVDLDLEPVDDEEESLEEQDSASVDESEIETSAINIIKDDRAETTLDFPAPVHHDVLADFRVDEAVFGDSDPFAPTTDGVLPDPDSVPEEFADLYPEVSKTN